MHLQPSASALLAALVLAAATAAAAPYKPADDAEVLLRVSPRALDAATRERAALRRQLEADPRQPELAERLARQHIERLFAEGDPREAGLAQAALQPWWTDPAPPPGLRLQRALLWQFQHRFDDALVELRALARADPMSGEAWAWIAAISMVQARYDEARSACSSGAPAMTALQAEACLATVEAATGQARPGLRRLQRALDAAPDADRGLRLWALTRLAETHERLGDARAAEAGFRSALALDVEDSYLRAAYSDFLLGQGRAAEVLRLLAGREGNDVLLLRLAIAAKASGDARRAEWQALLAERFDAARRRGDSSHDKEEARFALELLGDAPRALALARANHALQREAADARILLEAALAARDKAAAQPVLAWLRTNRFESVRLHALAAQVEALR